MTRRAVVRPLSALFLVLIAPLSAGGQMVQGISWSPELPVQGKLFVVAVDASADAAVNGRFAGEALHFQRIDGGRWWALAAVPVDSAGPMELAVEVSAAQRILTSVSIAPGAYRMERLRMAPTFTELSPALERRTEEEAARARQVALGAHATPRLFEDSIVRPRSSRITSGFGNGREFNGTVQSRHTGTDFEGAVGAPVAAAARGVVALVDQFYLGGNVIYIDHGAGLSTGYLHLSETRVAAGDTVQAGQRIGSVGATGRVTGPHLHFIVRYGGVTVDPMSLLELELPARRR
jgi:murein DD-endopeptidase MepM/ murein hydrolase activator NlpD